MNLKYTTFFAESFVNTIDEAKAILSDGNKILFVNVKGVKGIQNNTFNTYKQAQIKADELAQQYGSKNVFINIITTEVAEADEIDF